MLGYDCHMNRIGDKTRAQQLPKHSSPARSIRSCLHRPSTDPPPHRNQHCDIPYPEFSSCSHRGIMHKPSERPEVHESRFVSTPRSRKGKHSQTRYGDKVCTKESERKR
ncbi:hypothetical protein E2C01_069899 [Portunus trituberculatus]|uniref:Uncharacterized protein n=1 Tax=Portunus trituberculatus TaxID=210409 RepID=A0A5B7I0S2_PORTR|nr:hypothetical protein [Portunus trituberculatus]